MAFRVSAVSISVSPFFTDANASYLKKHKKCSIVFDHREVRLDESAFTPVPLTDWEDFYGEVQEEVPHDAPEPLGEPVSITAFVDSDHAGNLVTRRSHTGIVIFVQGAPIMWLSKRQNTVESSWH